MKTFSEIDTTCKRASRAIGFPWGVAEEIGKNMRMLEMFGIPGVNNLIEYFKIYNENNFQKINCFKKIANSSSSHKMTN